MMAAWLVCFEVMTLLAATLFHPAPVAALDRFGVCASALEQTETEATMKAIPLLEQAGVRWVRIGFRWSEIEKHQGMFSFKQYDPLVDLALKHHMRVLGVIVRTPGWANGNREEQAPPLDSEDWANAVAVIASHYRGKIQHWQIGNEPDIKKFWTGTPDDYVELLATAYGALKKTDPAIQVIAAGLDGTGEHYLELLLERGMAKSCDVLAFHPYAETPAGVVARTLRFRSVMAKFHLEKPLWITEIGWQTGGWPEGPGRARDERQKADYLKKAYASLEHYAEVVFWYRAVEGPRLYGLIEHAGGHINLLPAYSAFKEMAGARGGGKR